MLNQKVHINAAFGLKLFTNARVSVGLINR